MPINGEMRAMSDDLVFYTNPMSRGRIVRWMLEETAAPYGTEVVDYGEPMKSAGFRTINPMGKVPALVHHGHIVTECAAICAYLADTFPDAGLAPPLADRAAYYRWLFFTAGPFEAAVTNESLGVSPPEERQSMIGYGSLPQVLDALEAAVAGNDFLAGDRFSAADVYVGSQIGFGLQFGSIEKRAGFEAYWARVSDRDAWRRAQELDNALLGK